jgi:RNA polymerase sigma-70 factor (ECF subfamily)
MSTSSYEHATRQETTDPTDEQLVLLAKRGDSGAFTQLVQRHFAVCLKRALLMLRNRSDAEDEVQNAFAKAFQSLDGFRLEGSFSAWLSRIVRNQCLMLMREQRRAGLIRVDATTESNARLELIDQVPDQEHDLGSREVDRLLRTELSRVPLLMRDVMLLRDVEGLPMPEVAARLGLSLPAAKSRLIRARKEMRARLTKHCGHSGARTLMFKAIHHKAEYTYVS